MKDISKGYIALFRQFIEWEWFTDVNTCHLFIYCLLRANHKNTKWKGVDLKKGQFVTSYSSLSEATGLTYKQVRLGIDKLKRTGEVAHEGHTSYSIITIKNWDKFQEKGRQEGSQRATDNNENNISNISYINISLSIEERDILKKYLMSKPRKEPIYDWDAYFALMNKNGTLKTKLEKAKKWAQKKETPAEVREETPEEHEKIIEIQKQIRAKQRRG